VGDPWTLIYYDQPFLTVCVLGYAVHSLALVADSFHMVREPQCMFHNGILTLAIAERCVIIVCRIMGRQSCKPGDDLQYLHLRRKLAISPSLELI
jgi:hypothetical protein